jgi:hypothetical protein
MSITVPTAPKRVEKTVRKSLAVPLTEAEIKARTDQMVSDMTDLEKVEVEHKARKKEMSDETKDLKAAISKSRKVIVARTETKLVEDALEVFDIEAKRTWYEYRGQRFEERAMSEFEIRQNTKPPLFPEHEDSDGLEASDEGDDSDLNVVPLQAHDGDDVKDVIRAETKRIGKHDHTAG